MGHTVSVAVRGSTPPFSIAHLCSPRNCSQHILGTADWRHRFVSKTMRRGLLHSSAFFIIVPLTTPKHTQTSVLHDVSLMTLNHCIECFVNRSHLNSTSISFYQCSPSWTCDSISNSAAESPSRKRRSTNRSCAFQSTAQRLQIRTAPQPHGQRPSEGKSTFKHRDHAQKVPKPMSS